MSGQAGQLQQLMGFFKLEATSGARITHPAADPARTDRQARDGKTTDRFLEEAVAAHTNFKLRLRAFSRGSEKMKPADVSQDDLCALGKWLYGDGAKFQICRISPR